MITATRDSSLLALALVLASATTINALTCTGPDATGLIKCSATGPAAGRYSFPAGVTAFQVTALSSGNGGSLDGTGIATYNNEGGFGAQISTPNGAPTLAIDSRFPYVDYIVGGNGQGYTGYGAPTTTDIIVQGPPSAGDGYNGPSGGGFSAVPNYGLFLGAGGGAAPCGPGGAAGITTTTEVYAVGQDGQKLGANGCLDAWAGKGGQASAGGAGGVYNDGEQTGQAGSSSGSGDGGAASARKPGGISAGGGGGSRVGPGGGGVVLASGGGGTSLSRVPGVEIVQRADRGPTTFEFQYFVPFSSVTTTTSTSTATTTTLATTTTVSTELLTSTTTLSQTTTDPLSFATLTLPSTVVQTVANARKKAAVTSTSIVLTPSATVTVTATSALPPTCQQYQVFYPADCCPASWRMLEPISSSGGPSNGGPAPVGKFIRIRNMVDLAKRGSTIVTVTTSGAPVDTSTTVIGTFTDVLVSTSTAPAPIETGTTTSYTPTVTSTTFFDAPAETSTGTAFTPVTVKTTADPTLTVTALAKVVQQGPATTVTTSVTSQPTSCAVVTGFTQEQCTRNSNGQVDTAFKKRQLGRINTLKMQSGRQVIVNCGSAGSYLY